MLVVGTLEFYRLMFFKRIPVSKNGFNKSATSTWNVGFKLYLDEEIKYLSRFLSFKLLDIYTN